MPNYNQTLQINNSSLEEIITQLNNMPDAGGIDTFDATASADDLLSGKTAYVQGEKIEGTIPTKALAKPSISINSNNGLITATLTQNTGYVNGGTQSTTYQLAFQPASRITPGNYPQTAVLAQTYVGGAIIVEGDANLVPSNIVSGKSIFGVVGTATAGGGGGNTDIEDAFVTRNLTNYTNDRVKSIGVTAFRDCYTLTNVTFTACELIDTQAFLNCRSLIRADFPACISISSSAFVNCSSLATINFPACKTIAIAAFHSCYNLPIASFPQCLSIDHQGFRLCSNLSIANFPACQSMGNTVFQECHSLVSINFPACISIGYSAFFDCSNLINVDLPVCKTLGSSVFRNCINLKTVNLPACTRLPAGGFEGCTTLTTISLPVCGSITQRTFNNCINLTNISLPSCTAISASAFQGCLNLISLYLMNSRVCTLQNSNAFTSTPIGGYSASAGTYGSIFVPTSLLASYKNAANWSYFSSRFVGV